jgi:glutathione peroxidase
MEPRMPSSLYDIQVEPLAGGTATLGEHAGKVLLIVNTASKCGLTPHYAGLEKLCTRATRTAGSRRARLPLQPVRPQEPGSAEEIGTFCAKNYGVSFPMFAKIEVNGDGAHPLYKYLKQHAKGILGTEAIKWNFTKFLVSRDGEHIERYAPTTTPEELVKDIEGML